MGYDIWPDGEWTISAEKADEALQAVLLRAAKNDGYSTIDSWIEKEEPDPCPRTEPIDYINNRTDYDELIIVNNGGELSVGFADEHIRHVEERQWLFEAVAPYAEPDSHIHFEGEDRYRWTWEVENGKFVENGSEVVYGKNVNAPACVEKLVDVIYPEHMDGKPVTAFFDSADDYIGVVRLIENIIREAGFGPQAGKTELERLADV